MPDLSLFFEFQHRFVAPEFFELLKHLGALGVHEIQVEILYPAGGELILEKRNHIFFFV